MRPEPIRAAALAALALGGFLSLGAQAPQSNCAALGRLVIPNVEVTEAVAVASPGGPACRVQGIARPVPGSNIHLELWLPNEWNGRYYQLGNGGFAGNIHRPSLEAEAARGNAAAATDTGHQGDGFDARWAAGNPVAVVDYGHRSIKATSDAAAALIRAFYGRSARWRYFAGCSNGGRQALMAAQRYPEDWDGVLAGAPANLWTRQLARFAALQHRLRVVPGAWLRSAKLAAIQRAALASCPANTVAEGVALDPERCRFDPAALLCRGADRDDCLTPPQLDSLRAVQAAGYEPTSAVPENWAQWIVNPDPATPSQLIFATQAFRYLLGNRPAWRIEDFARERDWASPVLAATLDADATDYSRFRARGGRILSYFGWADAVIAPRTGLNYYRAVVRRAGSLERARLFYRLFMIPGMTHCQGGLGADSFGQSSVSPPLRADPEHDIRLALERWVEERDAPSTLVAARFREPAVSSDPLAIRRLRLAR